MTTTLPPPVEEQPEGFAVETQLMSPGAPPKPKPPFPPVMTVQDMCNLPEITDWVIPGLISRRDLVLLIGDAGVGKGYACEDMVSGVANGIAWCGGRFPAAEPSMVLYTIGEGRNRFRDRVIARESENSRLGIETRSENMRFVFDVPQLFDPKSPYNPREFLDHLTRYDCLHPSLLIIDTMQRASIGVDENSSKDVGMILSNIEIIQRETGAAVMLVHHTNKLGGVRGSTALRASADVVLLVQKLGENNHRLVCDKLKDGDYFDPIPFSFYKVEKSSVINWGVVPKTVNDDSHAGRVLKLLSDHPEQEFTVKEITEQLGGGLLPQHMTKIKNTLGSLLSTRRVNPELPSGPKNPALWKYSGDSEQKWYDSL